MCAWQEMRFRNDWTDLRGAATVYAGAVLKDGAANDFSFKLLHQLAGSKLILRRSVNKRFLCLCACNVQLVAAFRLVGQLIRCSNILADQLLKLVLGCGQVSLLRHCPRILGSLFSKLDDRLDDFLTCVMRKQDGTKHDFFRKLIGFGFNHHHGVICRCNNEVEITFGNLLVCWVQDIFAIQVTNACCADWTHEWNARNGHCSRCCYERQNIRLILTIIAKNLRNRIDFVVETFWEQRTKWTVDQTRNQRFLFGRTTFTFEEATGNTAGCGIFFLIVNGEREEILPFFHRLCGGNRAKHNSFAKRCHNSAVSLTGNFARFECQGLSAPLD